MMPDVLFYLCFGEYNISILSINEHLSLIIIKVTLEVPGITDWQNAVALIRISDINQTSG